MKKEVLIKSQERVKNYGEVFTPKNIVKDMLGMVKKSFKNEPIDAVYLEPACGNGNFLEEILIRKLKKIEVKKYEKEEGKNGEKKTQIYLQILKAVSSIYGIDIQKDNVAESRERLKKYILKYIKRHKIYTPVLDIQKKRKKKICDEKDLGLFPEIFEPLAGQQKHGENCEEKLKTEEKIQNIFKTLNEDLKDLSLQNGFLKSVEYILKNNIIEGDSLNNFFELRFNKYVFLPRFRMVVEKFKMGNLRKNQIPDMFDESENDENKNTQIINCF